MEQEDGEAREAARADRGLRADHAWRVINGLVRSVELTGGGDVALQLVLDHLDTVELMQLCRDEIMETYKARLHREYDAWLKAKPGRPPLLVAIDLLNDHVADVVGRELALPGQKEPYVLVNLRDPEKFVDLLDESIRHMRRKALEN